MNNNQFNKSMQTIKNYVDENIPTKTSQLTNDSGYVTNVNVDEKVASAFTNQILGLNVLSIVLGNYQIKYNETDDTLDFLYNGVIEEPPVEENSYVTDGLSMYIDVNDVPTYGSIRDITGNHTIKNNGVSTTSDNKYLNFVASESDYLDTNLVPNLSIWSTEIYFYYTSTPTGSEVLYAWGDSSDNRIRLGFSESAQGMRLMTKSGSYVIGKIDEFLVLRHIVVTGNNGVYTIYVDGKKRYTIDGTGVLDSYTGTLKIGTYFNVIEDFANINLKIFRHYDGKVLSAEEVLQNYNYEINRG